MAGIYGIGVALWGLAVASWPQLICDSLHLETQCLEVENAVSVVWSIVFGLVGGASFGRGVNRLVLAAVSLAFALPTVDVLAHRAGDAWQVGPTFLLAMTANLFGALAIFVAAMTPISSTPRSRRDSGSTTAADIGNSW